MPICKQPISKFIEFEDSSEKEFPVIDGKEYDLAYPKEFARTDKSARHMDTIDEMAISGESIVASMGTKIPMPTWDDILIMGCQLNHNL